MTNTKLRTIRSGVVGPMVGGHLACPSGIRGRSWASPVRGFRSLSRIGSIGPPREPGVATICTHDRRSTTTTRVLPSTLWASAQPPVRPFPARQPPDWTNTCRYDGAMDLSLDGETLVYAGDDPVNGSDPSGLCVSLFNVVCVGGGNGVFDAELPIRSGCGAQRRRQHRTWRQLRSERPDRERHFTGCILHRSGQQGRRIRGWCGDRLRYGWCGG